jgi:monoamine oxidase
MLLDVIVVGAGAAGLSAAEALKAHGLGVLVLEARDRVGGRVFSQALPQGGHIEYGAQWLASAGQNRLERLLAQSKFQRQESRPDDGPRLQRSRTGAVVKVSSPSVPNLPWYGQLEALLSFRTLDATARKVLEDAQNGIHDAALDNTSVAAWLQQRCWFTSTKTFLRHSIEENIGFDAEKASAYELCTLFAGLGYSKRLAEADKFYFAEGLQNLFKDLAARLGPDTVRFNTQVQRIEYAKDSVTVTTQDGQFKARNVILAIPPQLVRALTFDPPLEEERRGLLEGHQEGHILKLVAVFESRFWKQQGGLSGDIVSLDADFDMVTDVSHTRYGILAAFSSGQNAKRLCKLSEDELRALFIAYIETSYGCQAPPCLGFYRHDWIHDEFSRGAYTSRTAVGVLAKSNFFDISKPRDRVFFAGTETATEWRGYIEGALQSGERAAAQLAAANKSL